MASSTFYHCEPRWQASAIARWQAPVTLKPWLLGRGSLTTSLVAASKGNFRVEVLKQSVAPLHPSETALLGLKAGQRALVREVVLYGNNQPWIFARSVLPLSTLTGRLRALRKLDTRPLGHHLFSYPSMRRGPIELAAINRYQHYLPRAHRSKSSTQWARRSLFFLDQKPLLVSEVFLDSFSSRICTRDR